MNIALVAASLVAVIRARRFDNDSLLILAASPASPETVTPRVDTAADTVATTLRTTRKLAPATLLAFGAALVLSAIAFVAALLGLPTLGTVTFVLGVACAVTALVLSALILRALYQRAHALLPLDMSERAAVTPRVAERLTGRR